ncbi:MAG: hypothetical protein IK033_06380, partial [Verrucomicrobia bacterium]|nr:hypothetical protein [Verrucomicrobiota bacterium]
MNPIAQATRLKLLRFVLFASGIAWGASIFGVILPWDNAETLLQGLGAHPVEYDPMLNYWLRMAAGAFTLVGCVFFVMAWKPQRYAAMIPLFGWLMLMEGVILLISGLSLKLQPFPFTADTTFCLLAGAVILWLKDAAKQKDT